METLLNNKLTLSLAALFLVALIGYRFLAPAVPAENGDSALEVGQDLVRISDQLARATLSSKLFSEPGYLGLADITASIPQQTFGRKNPFNAIGQE